MLKVSGMKSTLRGESPKLGIPTIVLELGDNGALTELDEVARVLKQGVGEVVTVIGKPFRQLIALTKLIDRLNGEEIIIETSGRMTDLDMSREILVPLVDKTTLVMKPNCKCLNEANYGWMRNYRFSNSYYKFEWQGNAEDTLKYIDVFFNITNISMLKAAEQSRIIVMPANINNLPECRAVWKFCLTNDLRYSGRENRRLYT